MLNIRNIEITCHIGLPNKQEEYDNVGRQRIIQVCNEALTSKRIKYADLKDA